jgi:hypothetical protein
MIYPYIDRRNDSIAKMAIYQQVIDQKREYFEIWQASHSGLSSEQAFGTSAASLDRAKSSP